MPTDPSIQRFSFAFDARYRLPLLAFGVRPDRALVTVDEDSFAVRFGPWQAQTPLSNIVGAEVMSDYRWFRVVGPRLSMADRGATLGTNTDAGVCIRFQRPVPLLLGSRVPHPGLTVTVEDPERLVATLHASTS